MDEIRVIDFTAADAAEQLVHSFKEIGFAVLSHHPIDNALIDQVYADWGAFFNSAEKYNFLFDEKTHDGYIPLETSESAKGSEQKDLKEFYHYYKQGRCPDNLRSQTQVLYNQLDQMGLTLLTWLQQCTPKRVIEKLSMPLPDMVRDCDKTLFRLIHYPPLVGDEPPAAVRAAAHEDINFITLLPAATAKGLQAKNRAGQWLDVPCNPGWIVVNAADMLQECTQHYYPSTTHRVINPEDETARQSRLSMPLFIHAPDDVKLSERHTAASYRQERYVELGLSKKNNEEEV
jgi:isopenicillin N synthase-like dioxygenase